MSVLLDREEIQIQRSEKIARLLKIFGVVMAFFYVLIGIIILYFPVIEGISDTVKYLLCTLLISYGIFRFYRAIK